MEQVQYNACLVIIFAFKGISRDCPYPYQELGLLSLKDSRWHRKVFLFIKL